MYYNLTAIILRRQSFKDDDLLVTVYSAERGKVVLQAKGAKKIKSKLAGHLEPVVLSYLNITRGKSIDQLIGAQINKSYAKIKNNLAKTAYVNYFTELINELTHENHPDKNIFSLLKKSLDFLEKTENNNYKIARISFGFKLLHLLGFNPSMKPGIDINREIEYIIKNTVNLISQNKDIIKNLAKINKILDKELEQHLEKPIKTKEFLKQTI